MDRKYVFIDYYYVDPAYGVDLTGYRPRNGSPYGIKIVQHKPEIEREPIIKTDKPWDKDRAMPLGVFKISENDYVCFYEALNKTPEWICTCVAYSKDGVHWEKPDLGLVSFNNDKHNNIIRMGGAPYLNYVEEGNYVYYDPFTKNENERYKQIYTKVMYDKGVVQDVSAFTVTSKDGLHWENERRAFKGGDCIGSIMFDPDLDRYIATYKSQYTDHLIRRTMIISESKDFEKWTTPRIILEGNPFIEPDIDYYQTNLTKWPGTKDAYLMFLPAFHRTGDYVETVLATSRDLYNCYLWDVNNPIISRYDAEAMTQYMCPGVVVEKNKYIHYYAPFQGGHNGSGFFSETKTPETYRLIWREDGYTSLHAESHGGFTSIPLNPGKGLVINAEYGPMGYIKIAITDDENNTPYEGFSFEDCKVEKIDDIHFSVKFAKEFSALPEKTCVRLKVEMFKADLYSFTFLDCEEWPNEHGAHPYRIV